jgi:cytochrome c oxidase subunit II
LLLVQYVKNMNYAVRDSYNAPKEMAMNVERHIVGGPRILQSLFKDKIVTAEVATMSARLLLGALAACGREVKKITTRSPLSILLALLLALAIFLAPYRSVGAQSQDVKVIEITAKKYEFSPSPVHVQRGTKVQLMITATDHDHGFRIAKVPDGALPNGKDGLILASAQDCWELKKGETTAIEFLAQSPGTYTFKCCHTCGVGHGRMKGQIVVD